MKERLFESPEWIRVNCPECGEELSASDPVFTVEDGDTIAGCRYCLREKSAWEWYGEIEDSAAYWE